jgi:tricorn protease
MVTSFAAENKLATIIGTKTAGNVLGAANLKVGSGYCLRLPVFGWYTNTGSSVEGHGICPDLLVEVQPDELSGGIDRQLNTALDLLTSNTTDATSFPQLGISD